MNETIYQILDEKMESAEMHIKYKGKENEMICFKNGKAILKVKYDVSGAWLLGIVLRSLSCFVCEITDLTKELN